MADQIFTDDQIAALKEMFGGSDPKPKEDPKPDPKPDNSAKEMAELLTKITDLETKYKNSQEELKKLQKSTSEDGVDNRWKEAYRIK